MKDNLKLFVWEDVLSDYTNGIMFALAESKEEAITIIIDEAKKYNYVVQRGYLDWIKEELNEKEVKIYEDKVGFFVFGGG